MSINVTVSGNPVRINRGKMVTGYNPEKTEFEKRRIMRLQQVRDQSRNIAGDVRDRVRDEKKKCLSATERDGEAKLKNWQCRKLLELQDQYQEALVEIGLGHKGAESVSDEEKLLLEQQESNERVARERGRMAAERLQVEKNEENLRKAVPRQRKILTSDMENSRKNGKKGKSPNKKAKKALFDSDGENKVPQLELDEGSDGQSNSSEFEEVRRKRNTKEQESVVKASKELQTSDSLMQVPTSDKAAQTILHENPVLARQYEFPLDTRISERIRRRTRLNPEIDYCDSIEKSSLRRTPFCVCCQCSAEPQQDICTVASDAFKKTDTVQKSHGTCCHCPAQHQHEKRRSVGDDNFYKNADKSDIAQKGDTQPDIVIPDSDVIPEEDRFLTDERNIPEPPKKIDTHVEEEKRKSDTRGPKSTKDLSKKTTTKTTGPRGTNLTTTNKSTIPAKPKITLVSTKDRPAYIGNDPVNPQPVQFYDHPNRWSKQYLPKTSLVEKIDDQELEISTDVLNEEEIRKRMEQRDIEAHLRGQAALEKERVLREYRDLMKKLPGLQKQERIFEIGNDKEKYHMSRDRLEDLEKRRQNRLDNAYEELFVRKRPAIVTLPKRDGDRDSDPSLNLAAWDVDFDPKDTEKSRQETLANLVETLKGAKKSFLKEAKKVEKTLSQRDSSDDVKSKSTDYTRTRRRKRSRDERPLSPTASTVVAEESEKSKSTRKGASPSPRKKLKLKGSRKVLVLQNTSTQTTPKTDVSAATSPLVNTPKTDGGTCPCNRDSLDDLCEIVIKIKEDERPEVTVNPPYLGKSVRVVSEEIEPARRESPKQPSVTSWKEQLTHSGSSISTNSTAYLEPPAGRLKKVTIKPKSPEIQKKSRSINSTASSGVDGKLDPRLLKYIKKLLNMSRASIDDLPVSTVSDVSTPSHSVIETPSNNPLYQLMNVMKYFNLDAAELQKQLSYVSDESSKHYNTSESVTVTTSTSGGEKSEFRSCTDIASNVDKTETSKAMSDYRDVAASCAQRIDDLKAKIAKVRAEKSKILESSSSSSDKDLTTTSYKDLPEKKHEEINEEGSKMDSDELLKIDFSYAERLKSLSKDEIRIERRLAEEEPTDDDLLSRLKRLLEDDGKRKEKQTTSIGKIGKEKHTQSRDKEGNEKYTARKEGRTDKYVTSPNKGEIRVVSHVSGKKLIQDGDGPPVDLTLDQKLIESSKDGKTIGAMALKTTVSLKPTEDKHEAPLFLDIPKLPKLEAPSLAKKQRRPPTSKGLRVIAPDAAHELSTIIEADSQLSAKIDSPTKAKSTSSSKSDEKPEAKFQSANSSDFSELDTMETMLMSIGMEWAIPTLKKTREALAMTSSSSGSGSKGSEVSLREFLSKISASTSKSGSSVLSDSQGMSLIQMDNRRTSTPIIDNGKKDGPIFITDSDVSSVRDNSGKDSHEWSGSLPKSR